MKPQIAQLHQQLIELLLRSGLLLHESSRPLIQRGLLKIKQMHALARDVYYGKRGRVIAHKLHDQMNSCSCLTLIRACIIYWQSKEISRVISQCNPEENGINLSMLEHISPIEWENVVLYGEYVIDLD